jgi:hypothetical protein
MVYSDNQGGSYSNSTFVQSSLDLNPALQVFISFQSYVDPAYLPIIWNGLSLSLGVINDMLTSPNVVNSVFSWTLNTDRGSPISPLTMVAYFQRSVLNTKLAYAGITASYTFTYTTLQTSSYSIPSMVLSPNIVDIGTTYVTFNASANRNGVMCCIAESAYDQGTLISSEVYIGLGRNNTLVNSVCTSTSNNTVEALEVNGLVPKSFYNLSCVLCSSYPAWPACSSQMYSKSFNTTSIVNITVQTSMGYCTSILLVMLLI